MSRKVTTLPKQEPACLHLKDNDDFRQQLLRNYRGWSQHHKPPWIDRIVAPHSGIEFAHGSSNPVFRGLIKVKPPLGPHSAHVLKQLWILQEAHSRDYMEEETKELAGLGLAVGISWCKFHYWEEDADTGRIIREAAREIIEAIKDGEDKPKNDAVAYLAWNLSEKFVYPVEWLAYLGEKIF